MQQRLPDWIDPVSLIRQGRILEGRIPLERFARLAEHLYDTSGEIAVELHFGRFETGVEGMVGHIEGELRLTCQRCLEALKMPVRLDVNLGLVESEALIDRLPEGFEPLLLTEDRLHLIDLVEDELLLAIPDFPKHEEQDCHINLPSDADEAADAESKDNPFAVLNELKKQ